MTRNFVIAMLAVLAATVCAVASSPQTPDFWYVVPDHVSASNPGEKVRGIVIPTSVTPTVQTSAGGSVVSWRKPDGTRQSFVVRGVSAVTFEPGPLEGTIYVPFAVAKRLVARPDESCCSCASWLNSRESVEQLACVPGCSGCSCEGCVCSPSLPCPTSPLSQLTLVARGGNSPVMTFRKSKNGDGLSLAGRSGRSVHFRGKRLSTEITAEGETRINNPDAIELPGIVVSSSTVRGEQSLFAWVTPDASVILDQPRSMPAPTLRDGTIEFDPAPIDEISATVRRPSLVPVGDRCRACGTHPDSESDLDIYDCVPGHSVCYRCVSWEC
jgi:hypothetical protein